MSSNFERLQKIINQAYAEKVQLSISCGTQKPANIPLPVAKMIWDFYPSPLQIADVFYGRPLFMLLRSF